MDIFCNDLEIETEMAQVVQSYKKYILNLCQCSEHH